MQKLDARAVDCMYEWTGFAGVKQESCYEREPGLSGRGVLAAVREWSAHHSPSIVIVDQDCQRQNIHTRGESCWMYVTETGTYSHFLINTYEVGGFERGGQVVPITATVIFAPIYVTADEYRERLLTGTP